MVADHSSILSHESHLHFFYWGKSILLRPAWSVDSSSHTEVIYFESSTEPAVHIRDWLATKYVINLSSNPSNLTYNSVIAFFSSSDQWSTICSPCLLPICSNLKTNYPNLFNLTSDVICPSSIPPPPWSPLSSNLNGSLSANQPPKKNSSRPSSSTY